MAVVFTLVASTPNLLRYRCTSTGAQSGELTAATMLADAIPGSPIYDAINTPYTTQALARAGALWGPDLNVEMLYGEAVATFLSWGVDAGIDTTALKFVVASEGADDPATFGSYLTIEHRHSFIK